MRRFAALILFLLAILVFVSKVSFADCPDSNGFHVYCCDTIQTTSNDPVYAYVIWHTTDPDTAGWHTMQAQYTNLRNYRTGNENDWIFPPDEQFVIRLSRYSSSAASINLVHSALYPPAYPDDIDHSDWCEAELRVNPIQRFSDNQKRILTGIVAIGGFGGASASMIALKYGSVFFEPLGIILGVAVGTAGVLLWVDPPDPNYTEIPWITPPPFPVVSASGENGVTYADAYAMNQLLTNETQLIGVYRAAITSVNRASSAHDAGDTASENAQQAAITRFLQLQGYLLNHEADLRENLANVLTSEGKSWSISENEEYQAQKNWSANGWSANEMNLLISLGADSDTIRKILSKFITYPPADEQFPNILISPNQNLRSYAQSTIQELPEPNQELALLCSVGLIAVLRRRKVRWTIHSGILIATAIGGVMLLRDGSKLALGIIVGLNVLNLIMLSVNWHGTKHIG